MEGTVQRRILGGEEKVSNIDSRDDDVWEETSLKILSSIHRPNEYR
jgi:hypothetical protein